jgi:hypothetical protein
MKSTRIAGITLAASLAGGLVATAAGAAFDDVNENSPYAEHINSVQAAGIATGYPDGSFRPTNPISRQQAAAWIDRAATRTALDFADQDAENDPVNPNDPNRVLATVEVTSPAVDGGGGWVNLEGYVAAATEDTNGTGCPCAMNILVFDGEHSRVAISALTVPGPESADERPFAGPVGISPLAGAVFLPGGTTQTFTLEIELVDADVGDVFVAGTLSALYTPMAEGDPATITESAPSGPASLVPGRP